MTQRELRNIIVKQLHTYLAGPKVVLSDQTAPEADYPLIYYQSVQQHIQALRTSPPPQRTAAR